MRTQTAANIDRPFDGRSRRRLYRLAIVDARRRVLPEQGSTPTSEFILNCAANAVATHLNDVRQRNSELRVLRAGVKEQLASAERARSQAERAANDLPLRPDLERLPERAVAGDPNLIRSLTVAKAESDLRSARVAATVRHDSALSQRDSLGLHVVQLDEQLSQLQPEMHDYVRYVAAEADMRIAYYSTVLLRWHKSRERLRPLLPLRRVRDELDQLVDDQTLDDLSNRPSKPSTPTAPGNKE